MVCWLQSVDAVGESQTGRVCPTGDVGVGAARMLGVSMAPYYSVSLYVWRTSSDSYKVQGESYSRDAADSTSIPNTDWVHVWQRGWSLHFTLCLPGGHPLRISHNPLGTDNVIIDVVIQKL